MKHKYNFKIQFFKARHFLQKMFLFYFFLFSILGNFTSFSNKIYAEENKENSNLEVIKGEEKENEEVANSFLNKENLNEEIKTENDLPKENLESSKVEEVKKEEILKKVNSKFENKNLENIKVQVVDYSNYKIRINEIFPNPVGSDTNNEFVEIYNYGEENIDLTNWKIKDLAGNSKNFSGVLSPNSFALIYCSFLNNSTPEQVILISPDNSNFSEKTYENSIEGQSLNFDENEWYWIDPTPNAENLENPTTKNYPKILINEVFPNPSGVDTENEFIELYNPNDFSVNLKNWILEDEACSKSTTTSCRKVFGDFEMKPFEYKVFYQNTDFSFSLNNDGDIIYLKTPNPNIETIFTYQNSQEGLSFNFDVNGNYLAEITPNAKNLENPLTKIYPKIIINEVLPNPSGIDAENEFIELYNPNNEVVILKNWTLEDGSGVGKFTIGNEEIQPLGYLVFYQSKDFSFTLNNDFDQIILTSPNPNIKTIFDYENSTEGLSINFNETKNYSAKPTPDAQNNENPLTKNYPNLILSEILPNPVGDEETSEFIEIYNPNNFEVNLESWILKDSSTSGSYIFNENQKISANSYLAIYRSDFQFALNNSGGETIYLISPNQKVQSEISYESAKENVSYNFNQQDRTWRWSKFLTPNFANKFNNLPEIKKFSVDEKVYKNVYVNFKVEANDLDGDELKYIWDFGDGRKSYKAETYHKYLKTGTYQTSLKIQDGSEEVVKNFFVIVKKYPKYDLEIVKIVPNPKGLDSLNEYIVIKNNSGKKVDLKGWSLATGSDKDKLYNHPIRENLEIGSKKSEKITRKFSAFSLPNKKGYLELRQPDGEMVDKIFYEKDKIQNDESFEKNGKKWEWILSKENQLTSTEIQKIIAQALKNEKILQEESLEQKVAEKVIQREKIFKNKKEIPLKEISFWEKFSSKINLFLNENLPNFNSFLASLLKSSNLSWLIEKLC